MTGASRARESFIRNVVSREESTPSKDQKPDESEG